MLASASANPGEAFDRKGWIFEFKYDGYRLFAEKSADGVRLLSRNGLSLTEQFPDIAHAVKLLPYEQLLIDGELVVHDATGRPSFSALQTRAALSSRTQIIAAARHQPATLYAFDLIEALQYDLRESRTRCNANSCSKSVLPTVGPVRYSQHIDEQGRSAFAAAQRLGIEGIVGKRAASHYQSGRSTDWIKVRTRRTGDFVVVGWQPVRSNPQRRRLADSRRVSQRHADAGRTRRFRSRWRATQTTRQATARNCRAGEPLNDDDGHWVKPELRLRSRVSRIHRRRASAAAGVRQDAHRQTAAGVHRHVRRTGTRAAHQRRRTTRRRESSRQGLLSRNWASRKAISSTTTTRSHRGCCRICRIDRSC